MRLSKIQSLSDVLRLISELEPVFRVSCVRQFYESADNVLSVTNRLVTSQKSGLLVRNADVLLARRVLGCTSRGAQ